MLLNQFLTEKYPHQDTNEILLSIAKAVESISINIANCDLGLAGNINESGEMQMSLDILANNIIKDHLQNNSLVLACASEEEEKEVLLNPKGTYLVAFDPLDGSSLINTNLAIGSIFGVYKGHSFIGQKGQNQVLAVYAVYGPRTTLVFSFGQNVYEFTLNGNSQFNLTRTFGKIKPNTRLFSPGNLRAALENSNYLKLINTWIIEQKTLRYSGGMVPDINSIFCKEEGIFTYPKFSKYPNGKLRLLYECAPFAFLIKAVDGIALDEEGRDILALVITDYHQRSTIFIGSKQEVVRAIEFLL